MKIQALSAPHPSFQNFACYFNKNPRYFYSEIAHDTPLFEVAGNNLDICIPDLSIVLGSRLLLLSKRAYFGQVVGRDTGGRVSRHSFRHTHAPLPAYPGVVRTAETVRLRANSNECRMMRLISVIAHKHSRMIVSGWNLYSLFTRGYPHL
jgi:hypothetical protein